MRNSLPESLIIVAYGNKFRMQNTSRLWIQVSVEVLMCLCLFFMFFNIIFFFVADLLVKAHFSYEDCAIVMLSVVMTVCSKVSSIKFNIVVSFIWFLFFFYVDISTGTVHVLLPPLNNENPVPSVKIVKHFFSSLKQKRVGIILKRVNSKENFFRPIAM